MADGRTAALLIRIWLEDGSDQLRARVTAVNGQAPEGDHTVALASSTGDVIRALRDWLDEFTRHRSVPE